MKIKKTYSIEQSLAIKVDIKAAKDQVFSSSIVEKALMDFFKSKVNSQKKTA